MAKISITDFQLSSFDTSTEFIVDTNVLYFIHSGYYKSKDKKRIAYSNLIGELIKHGFKLVVSSVNLQELFYGIENKEYELYIKTNNKKKIKYNKKKYRANLVQKQNVKNKLKTLMFEINNIYDLIDVNVEHVMLSNFVNDFDTHRYDPLDYVLANKTNMQNVVYISDDSDFAYDSNITVISI